MQVEVFIDGSSRNNGVAGQKLEAACAVVIYDNRKEVVRFVRGLGERSNNAAEYEALIAALLICSMSDFRNPIIYSDSLLVVNQVNNKWRCKRSSNELLPLLMTVKIIQQEFPFHLFHVPREKVKVPDALCRKFLEQLDMTKRTGSKDTRFFLEDDTFVP